MSRKGAKKSAKKARPKDEYWSQQAGLIKSYLKALGKTQDELRDKLLDFNASRTPRYKIEYHHFRRVMQGNAKRPLHYLEFLGDIVEILSRFHPRDEQEAAKNFYSSGLIRTGVLDTDSDDQRTQAVNNKRSLTSEDLITADEAPPEISGKKYSDNEKYLRAAITYLGRSYWWAQTASKMAEELNLDEKRLLNLLSGFPGLFRRSTRVSETGEHYYSLMARYMQYSDAHGGMPPKDADIPPLRANQMKLLVDSVRGKIPRE